MFRVRLVCKLVCGKRVANNPKSLASAGWEGRVAFFATLRLLCCYSCGKVGEEQMSPPGRDGRVAFFAALLLLCGGGLEGAPAAPLLLRRGG